MARLHADLAACHPALPPYAEVLGLHDHPEEILGIPALTDSLSTATGIPSRDARALIRREKRRLSYEERPRPFLRGEIIERIREWQGIPVLAHPYAGLKVRGTRREPAEVARLVRELVDHGLAGVEVASGDSGPTETAHLLSLCLQLGLLPTIGSDFHYEGNGRHPSSLEPAGEQVKQKILKWLHQGK